MTPDAYETRPVHHDDEQLPAAYGDETAGRTTRSARRDTEDEDTRRHDRVRTDGHGHEPIAPAASGRSSDGATATDAPTDLHRSTPDHASPLDRAAAVPTKDDREAEDARPLLPRRHQRVLLVEDDPVFAKLLTTYLRQSEENLYQSVTATSLREALERLAEDSYDVIITDLLLPDSRDYTTIETLNAAAPDVPIVVLTGTAEGGIGPSIRAVRKGAAYFLRKGSVDGAAVERGIRYARERGRLHDLLSEDSLKRDG